MNEISDPGWTAEVCLPHPMSPCARNIHGPERGSDGLAYGIIKSVSLLGRLGSNPGISFTQCRFWVSG